MKKHFILAALVLLFGVSAMAQEEVVPAKDSHWHGKGNIGLNFSQGSYTNWAAGGQNTLAWMGTFNYSIQALADLPDNTRIRNTAEIFFDFNDPIETPTTINTIDAAPPSDPTEMLRLPPS